jgi:hypothetical protein
VGIFDTYNQPCTITGFSGSVHDAFGRLRVSSPETLFDSKQLVDNQPLFWDDQEVSGGGTGSSHSTALASTTISVGATTAGKRVRQTFQRFNYQPGKSQLILMTGQIDEVGAGISAAMGLFDDANGIFVSINEGTLGLTVRSSTSGTQVDNTVTQSNWNGDKLDGTGSSGHTLNPTATQIFWIDFEWLGVGSVRCGFVINGEFILCHTFHHANTLGVVYMSNPNLPLRYEIENDGTGEATSMQHICSTVMSEGGEDQLGYTHWISTGGTHVDLPTENTLYAVLGVRLKSTWLNITTHLREIEINEQSGNKIYEWELVWEPTVAGTFTYADVDADTALQRAVGSSANTVTGGHKILGGFATSAVKGGSDRLSINTALRAGAYIDGTPTELVLCVRPVGGSSNIDIEAGINFQQLV